MRRITQHELYRRPAQSLSAGITVVEILVVIAIVAVLMALILPAIQSSRETARRMTCSNRLRQIGIGVQSHEELHHRYPGGAGELVWEFEILPFVDQSPLYQSLKNHADDWRTLQQLVPGVNVPAFQCPSDPESLVGYLSYVQNVGSTFLAIDYNGVGGLVLSSRDIKDGLSQTAFASEALSVQNGRQGKRSRWKMPVPYTNADELDLFADLCAEMPNGSSDARGNERYLNLMISGDMKYDHIMTPNQPSCRNYAVGFYSTDAASSDHRGGVNVLFADGAVKFVGNGVARKVWRAVGTRNGHEAVSVP